MRICLPKFLLKYCHYLTLLGPHPIFLQDRTPRYFLWKHPILILYLRRNSCPNCFNFLTHSRLHSHYHWTYQSVSPLWNRIWCPSWTSKWYRFDGVFGPNHRPNLWTLGRHRGRFPGPPDIQSSCTSSGRRLQLVPILSGHQNIGLRPFPEKFFYIFILPWILHSEWLLFAFSGPLLYPLWRNTLSDLLHPEIVLSG